MPQYQEKNKSKLPKSGYSWYYRCYYTDMYGNRKQKQSKMYPSKSLAKEAEMDFLTKTRTTDEVDYNIMFKYVFNKWLEYKLKKVKITTWYKIEKALKKHILEYFKSYKLHCIKEKDINSFSYELKNKKLSIRYINRILGYLQEILSYASVNYGYNIKISNNITKFRDDSPKENLKDSETNFLTLDEFEKLIINTDDEYYELIYTFFYKTGIRLGEFLSLKWKDVDFINKTIKINKSLSKDCPQKGTIIVKPKTNNSIRLVDIDDELTTMLLKYQETQKKIYGYNENWFIFGGIKEMSPTTMRRYLAKHLKKANIKKITIHGFRHSHVSLLINLGCDSRDVAERIGDTVQVVEKTYYHMFPKKKKETVTKLNLLKLRGN